MCHCVCVCVMGWRIFCDECATVTITLLKAKRNMMFSYMYGSYTLYFHVEQLLYVN